MVNFINKWFVTPERWAYVRSHQLALWVFIGLTAQGIIGLFLPDFRAATAITVSLPVGIAYAVYALFAFGGALAGHGMTRGDARSEGAGCFILAAALFIQFVASLHVFDVGAVAGAVLPFTLAVGCISRGIQVAGYGKVADTITIDAEDLEEINRLIQDIKANGHHHSDNI